MIGFSEGPLSEAELRVTGEVLDGLAEDDAFLLEGILVGTNSLASGLKDVGLPLLFARVLMVGRARPLSGRRLRRGEAEFAVSISSSGNGSISLRVGKGVPKEVRFSAMLHRV